MLFAIVTSLKIWYTCVINIMQKLHNKIHLNCACIYIFLYTVYFDVDNFFFLCTSTSSLSWIQRFFSKMKLLKTYCTQLKQTNLESRLHISKESPKEGFDDAIFHHFMDELKHFNSDRRMDLQLLLLVFWCLYSIYLVAMLSFRMIFFITCFALFIFPCELAVF